MKIDRPIPFNGSSSAATQTQTPEGQGNSRAGSSSSESEITVQDDRNGKLLAATTSAISRTDVVAIKALSSCAKAEDFCEDKLLSGDVVEQLSTVDGKVELKAPFAGGKVGLQRELRSLYNSGQTLLQIKVKKGQGKIAMVRASIIPGDSSMLKKQYVLKATDDANHVVLFTDSTEEECMALQEMRCARMVSHVTNTQLTSLYVPYSWEDKMKELLPVENSSMVFSMVVIPMACHDSTMPQYNNVEDTVARAMTWLTAAQGAGVPINFLNIQTEPLLTKISGQGSRRGGGFGEEMMNAGSYGLEDYHGIDVGMVRAVRVWYVPEVGEIAVDLQPHVHERRLGVSLSRTLEGFCYVLSVEENTAADRAGLKELLHAAKCSNKLLVLSRVGDEKITPWLVSSKGAIRCFDTTSISLKLSMYRQANCVARLHLMTSCDFIVNPTMHLEASSSHAWV